MPSTELDVIRRRSAEVVVLQPGEDAEPAPEPALVPAWYWVRRNRIWLIPLAAPFGLFTAGAYLFLNRMFGLTLLVAAASVAVVVLMAPRKWDRVIEQRYAVASVAAAGLWLSAAAYLGPATPLLALILAAGCTAWAVPWWKHKRVRPVEPLIDTTLVDWNQRWQAGAVCVADLAGSCVTDVRVAGAVESVLVLLPPAVTSRQATSCREQIESFLDLDAGALRMTAGARQREVWLHVRHGSPLADEVEWDDSVAPTSVREPGIIGVQESGAMLLTSMLGNWFIIGQKRSGKSNEISVLLANLTKTIDAHVWFVDFKGGRAARPWLKSLDWFASARSEAALMMEAAYEEIQARAASVYGPDEQLEPTPEIPAIFLILDEANEIIGTTRGDKTLAAYAEAIASLGNGVCVYIAVVTQYGSLDALRTEQLRGNLDKCMAFRTQRADHGQFALRDWARLDTSKLNHQGMFFFQDGPEADSKPGRGQHIPHDQVRVLSARNEQRRSPLRLVSQRAAELHAGRWGRLPETFLADAPDAAFAFAHPGHTPAVTAPPEDTMPDSVTLSAPDFIDVTPQERAARIESELTDVSLDDLRRARAAHGSAGRHALMEQIVSSEEVFIRMLVDAPDSGVSPKQLQDNTGFGRTWVHEWLRALREVGAVEQLGRGRYRAVAGEDLWKAMEATRAANDQLLQEAKTLISA